MKFLFVILTILNTLFALPVVQGLALNAKAIPVGILVASRVVPPPVKFGTRLAKAVSKPIKDVTSLVEDRVASTLAENIVKNQKWILEDWQPAATGWTKDRLRQAFDLVCVGKYRPERIFKDFANAVQNWSANHHPNPKMINTIINSICAIHMKLP